MTIGSPTIEERLDQWQHELLDLSSRNRLLNFRPSTSRPSSIQFLQPPAAEVYQSLLQGTALRIIGREPVEDDGEAPEDPDVVGQTQHPPLNTISQDLLNSTSEPPTFARAGTVLSNLVVERSNKVAARLSANARASEQEQGVNILFVAFGLLKWKERPGETTWRQSPLVLLPVKLEEVVREGVFRVSATGDDPEFNQTLSERLKRDFAIDLSLDIDEDTPLASVLDEVREAVAGQQEWSVLDQAHLGTFQFHKLRMFTDLVEHADVAIDHEIVQALGLPHVGIAPLPEGLPAEEDLDRVVSPETSFTVLDADASQLRAIQAAVRGSHLIVEGPPGTGKSQTIANIIAESIAAGKTVLFVSEKAAAIEVVHKRLAERRLGDLCLMLHSHKANKRDVIYDLGNQLQATTVPPASAREELAGQRLRATREQLNQYAEVLHRTHDPLGESVFWAHGRLAELRDAPFIGTGAPDAELTHERLDSWSRAIELAGRHTDTLLEGEAHPWYGVRHDRLTTGEQESFRHAMRSTGNSLAEVQEAADALADLLGVTTPGSVRETQDLIDLAASIPEDGGLKPTWLTPERAEERITVAREAVAHAESATAARAKLLDAYEDAILAMDVSSALASYRKGALARWFSSAYRQHRSAMRAVAKDRQQRPPTDEISALLSVQQIKDDEDWWNAHRSNLLLLLDSPPGHDLPRESRAWSRVERDVTAAAQLVQRFGGELPSPLVSLLGQSRPGDGVRPIREQLLVALERLQRQLELLGTHFSTSSADHVLLSSSAASFGELTRWTGVHTSRLEELDSYLRARLARRGAEEEGLGGIVNQLQSENVPVGRWADALNRLVITHWMDERYRQDEALLTFSGDEHDAIVRQFRMLDRQHITSSEQRIRRALSTKRVAVDAQHGGEPALIRREAQKRKRHMPLRRLFERIPNVLPALKPCLMMSPLSVAQFLPADRYHFDLVIFDEASQVKPHDAIGAIMRGRQIIVAGDRKQLPPTNFFDRAADDASVDDEHDFGALESILDELRAKDMPSTQLLWHYRSRHEELIAFSNRNFYDSQLITFPSASAQRSPTRGVRLEYVSDAVYEDERDAVDLTTRVRVNRVEARRVARLVMQHARTRPEESLGVVALNIRQKEVIEEELKQARSLDRTVDSFFDEGDSDAFFVKALEQVQGDERDVIMISVGYGKGRDGKLSHHFGHLNREGGERRLNVLVTRARLQVIVVSSIRAGDIEVARTQQRGPLLLKSYLDFAERGQVALEAQTSGGDGDFDSPFEEQVSHALVRAGYTVHRQVGTSRFRIDLAIVHPDQPGAYLLGIECDGKTYHQSKTARDRDRLRQDILEDLGWTIHRIWSTDWIRQPDRELDKVVTRVAELLSESTDAGTDVPSLLEDEIAADLDIESINLEATYAEEDRTTIVGQSEFVAPYTLAEIRPQYGGYGDLLSVGPHLIAEMVTACVDVEGPIHRDLLMRRVTVGFGHQRAGSRIAAHVSEAIGIAVSKGWIRRHGPFLWPPHERPVAARGPALDGSVRDITHIAEEEIMQVMVEILRRAFSLSQDELIARTSRLFGYQRTGTDIKRRLEAIANDAVSSGRLSFVDERLQLSKETT